MQVQTLKFDDYPETLYVTFDGGTFSLGTETRSIGSLFGGELEPEVADVVQTEPIVDPDPDSDAGGESE